jgi:hypothetical protein
MAKRSRTPIHYSFWPEFECITFVAPVQVSRDEVPQVCEGLHSFVSSKRGASFYYPSIPNRMTACRYEWPRRWGREPFALRLGFLLIVGDSDLNEIHLYVTTNEAVENPKVGPPKISARFLNTLRQELIDALTQVFNTSAQGKTQQRYSIFYVEMPSSVDAQTEIEDGIVIFPTVVVRKTQKRISAIAVKVGASSDEGAKLRALHKTMLICALLSLANREVYKTTQVPVRRNLPRIKPLDSVENVDLDKLYPISTRPPGAVKLDVYFAAKAKYVWNLFHKLSEGDRHRIMPALFAYYTGLDIVAKQPTLAIVAFIAALSSLASDSKQKCAGSLTCSTCGSLDNFAHDRVGDRAAVTSLVYRLLGVKDSAKQKEFKRLIGRVYKEQRSAFVHGATLRYEEYHKETNLPAAFPTASEPVRPLYFYKRDLGAIDRITRRALLEWMCQKNGDSLDRSLLNLDDIKIESVRSVEAVLTLPAQRWVHIITNPVDQNAEDSGNQSN